MARPSSYINSQFASANVAKRLVVDAYVPKLIDQGVNVQALIEEPLNETIEGFFQDLVGYMGSSLDLLDQLPSVPGLRSWNKLTLAYTKRKQSTEFFIYSMLPAVANEAVSRASAQILAIRKQAAEKTGRRLIKPSQRLAKKRAKETRNGATLIGDLSRVSGIQAFGGVQILLELTDVGNIKIPVKAVITRSFPRSSNRKGTYQYTQTVYRTIDPQTARLFMTVRLWTRFEQGQLAKIESALASAGVISDYDRTKLINKGGANRRPLIVPFMTYYSRIKLPAVIRQAVSAAFKRVTDDSGQVTGSVNIQGSKRIGPL